MTNAQLLLLMTRRHIPITQYHVTCSITHSYHQVACANHSRTCVLVFSCTCQSLCAQCQLLRNLCLPTCTDNPASPVYCSLTQTDPLETPAHCPATPANRLGHLPIAQQLVLITQRHILIPQQHWPIAQWHLSVTQYRMSVAQGHMPITLRRVNCPVTHAITHLNVLNLQ